MSREAPDRVIDVPDFWRGLDQGATAAEYEAADRAFEAWCASAAGSEYRAYEEDLLSRVEQAVLTVPLA